MTGKKRILSPLPVLDEKSLLSFFQENDIKDIHAKTVWNFIINNPNSSFDDLPSTVPDRLGTLLKEKFSFCTSSILEEQVSSDGTVKLLVGLQDGQNVEAVIITHEGRRTLCVSSQIGCAMGCTFCATGTMGIIGDLMAGEILEQLWHARRWGPIRNIVFMGMGEPLNNYDAVLSAIQAMSDVQRFQIAPSYITLSTVGVIPRMLQLTKEAPYVHLALSLHAPNQDLREEIVPSARAFPLDKLMAALDTHLESKKKKSGPKVLIEYVLLKDVNDSLELAHQLGNLLQGRDVIVNLIPYNSTSVEEDYQPPSKEATEVFRSTVATYGLITTVRINFGTDIAGACGQLAIKQKQGKASDKDIEDLFTTANLGKNGKNKSNKEVAKIKSKIKTRKAESHMYNDYAIIALSIWLVVLVLILIYVNFINL
mmetsp:Transcript_1090/g.1423  ORF Transcript_1090/g.1423 Transcript_1090/m.1423 type:complete len:425 (-) Transcript_1090:30-1304(-)